MGASWRIGVDEDEDTTLVTGGRFGLVRNPIFTAMVLTAAGLALMVPNAVALTGLAMLVGAVELPGAVGGGALAATVQGPVLRRLPRPGGPLLPAVGVLRSLSHGR